MVAARRILLAKSFIQPVHALRRLYQQLAQKAVALLADRAQPLMAARAMFARNQSHIAGHLPAVLEPAYIPDSQHKGQRCDRPHTRLRHQQSRLRMFFRRESCRCIQLAHLPVKLCQQLQQIFAPPRRPAFQGKLFKISPPPRAPQGTLLLQAAIQRQVLQPILHPGANLHQLVPMNQQLAQITLLCAGHPQPRKPALHQKPENVSRIAPVGLLPAHITGTYLRRIPYPNLVAQPLQQLDKPLAVAARLNPNKCRRLQLPIEPFRLTIPVDQFPFDNLPALRVKNRNLLPTGVEITSYNLHRRLLLDPRSFGPQPKNYLIPEKPSSLSHQGPSLSSSMTSFTHCLWRCFTLPRERKRARRWGSDAIQADASAGATR